MTQVLQVRIVPSKFKTLQAPLLRLEAIKILADCSHWKAKKYRENMRFFRTTPELVWAANTLLSKLDAKKCVIYYRWVDEDVA